MTDSAPVLSETDAEPGSESLLTVAIAGLMNLAIAAAKLVAGLLSGSAAMLSEAAHSAADTVTEIMLFFAVRNAQKPADERHPFGYGQSAYLWAAMAAAFTFVAGGLFAITHGFHSLHHAQEDTDYLVSYTVLAIAFALESVSFVRSLKQTRTEAKRLGLRPFHYLRQSPDTSLRAVVLEDLAALVGLVLAGLGLLFTEITGDSRWDAASSIVIGFLLLLVAVRLGHANISLLVGRALPSAQREEMRAIIESVPTVISVKELLTLQIGPHSVLVAAKVDLHDEATGAQIEAASNEADSALRERFPQVIWVFLDPTPTDTDFE
ncbi:cation diffusion facilitator family transporter [Salininema proteolyticum]|uniref:Cation diffusion facilitator family transporter n=1 Tax=Salininema proteolyticum TaxID=1607685 RepID=A0ABV8TWL2_9ACTN